VNKAKTHTRGAPMSLPAVLAFSATSIPVSALILAVSVHLPRYFASHMELSLAVVGAAFALVRAIDIPLDPMLGLLMDRTRTRIGRYRFWTLLGAPVMMLSLYMLIRPSEALGQGYLIVWLLVMYLGLSILLLSHLAWAATLAPDYNQRSRIFGALTFIGVGGAVVALFIPIVMDALGYSDAQGVQAMVWFIIIAAPIAAGVVAFSTPERVASDHAHRFGLQDYWSLLTRPNVIRIMAADLFITLGPGWMAAVYLFYFKDARGFTTSEANLLLVIYILAGFAGAPFTAWLANRISKHRALMVCTTVYSLTLLSLTILPKGDFVAAIPTLFVTGAMAAGFIVMIRALTGDIGDEIHLESGREWMGLMYALTNATTKVAGAASIFLTFNVLAQVGYDAREGAVNTPEAIRGLELAFLIGPIFFVMLGGAWFIGYRLTQEKHAEVRRQLEERDALYDEAPVLESLTAEPAGVAPPEGR
jgi:GPH family glycoside/pentoside/hexuronide:cation symporter